MDSVAIFVPLAFFAAAVTIIYIIMSSRHRERMAMIEKGYDASLLKPAPARDTGKYSSLKWGIASLGIGIGLIFGHLLATNTNMEEEGAYFSMIFIFGGIGLVIYYLIVRRHQTS